MENKYDIGKSDGELDLLTQTKKYTRFKSNHTCFSGPILEDDTCLLRTEDDSIILDLQTKTIFTTKLLDEKTTSSLKQAVMPHVIK